MMTLALAPGGRIVVVNHSVPFVDAAQLPVLTQHRIRSQLGRSMAIVFHERHGRFDVLAFRKARPAAPGRGR
jgi:hypothetical protein